MPVVTVRSSPNGLPIATTGSPTSTFDESASVSGVSASGLASTLSRAMSVDGSLPTSVAFRVSSFENRTSIEVAPSMTWKFVAMCPCLSSTKPDPSAVARLLELARDRGRGGDRGRDLHDAGAAALVDLVHRERATARGRRRAPGALACCSTTVVEEPASNAPTTAAPPRATAPPSTAAVASSAKGLRTERGRFGFGSGACGVAAADHQLVGSSMALFYRRLREHRVRPC